MHMHIWSGAERPTERRAAMPARGASCLCLVVAVAADPRPAVRPSGGVLMDSLRNGCASGLATICAKAMLQPFDTLKTLQQTRPGKPPRGLLLTASTLVRERGVGSLYRGLGIALLGSVPAMSAYFAVYQSCKRTLHDQPWMSARPMMIIVFSAALANSFASALRVPCELVKQRLQAGVYPSVLAAWRALRLDGPRGFYVPGALSSQVARDIPFGVVMFLAYESMWNALQRERAERPAPWMGALCGAIAGSAATIVTNPVDVLKTRIMTGGASSGQLLAAASSIWHQEGPAAFYRGALPRLLHKIPLTLTLTLTLTRCVAPAATQDPGLGGLLAPLRDLPAALDPAVKVRVTALEHRVEGRLLRVGRSSLGSKHFRTHQLFGGCARFSFRFRGGNLFVAVGGWHHQHVNSKCK